MALQLLALVGFVVIRLILVEHYRYREQQELVRPMRLGLHVEAHRDLARRLSEDDEVAALDAAWELPPAQGSF